MLTMGLNFDFDMISTAYAWALLLLAAAALVVLTGNVGKHSKRAPLSQPTAKQRDSEVPDENPEDTYYSIEPLNDFDVDAEEPIRARPFKPKYHMTMALENTTLSDLIAMDKTYQSRIQIRRNLIKTQHQEVIAANPKATPAVLELYTWLTATYLPTRFPTLFTLTTTGLLNKTTSETLPLVPTSAPHALELLGSHIDNEFLFLLPSDKPSDESKYRLEAFMTCFPSGFRTRSKLGLLLADIHGPVPHYKQKLEKSMDRFFASLRVGRIVKRWNWTISTTGDLFCLQGNHGSAAESAGENREEEVVDLRTTVLRCERQTLHRLPLSGALVFAFKTYQYPLSELREEGGEALCEAIDGMAVGSAPDMVVYKRQVVWGKKVKAYLRGEIGIDA